MSEEIIDADHLTPRDQEIIARLRRTYDAINRGDFDSAIEIADPDIELVTPGLTARRGVDELRAWLEPVTIENGTAEPESFQIVGNKVLVRHHARGRGVASGINIDGYFWVVWTINEDGLATRMVGFRDQEEAKARQAAGLSE
jgi:ketosteroid isomerase-like protein